MFYSVGRGLRLGIVLDTLCAYVGAGVLTCPAERSSAGSRVPLQLSWRAVLARPDEDACAYVVRGTGEQFTKVPC
jgi:hypothetical protein